MLAYDSFYLMQYSTKIKWNKHIRKIPEGDMLKHTKYYFINIIRSIFPPIKKNSNLKIKLFFEFYSAIHIFFVVILLNYFFTIISETM